MDVEAFVRQLRPDSLVHLDIGEEGDSFLINIVKFENTCEAFENLVSDSRLMGSIQQPLRIQFPNDDLEAWKHLLYWTMENEFPRVSDPRTLKDVSLLVRCWLLGDKYDIRDFKEIAMDGLQDFRICNGADPELSGENVADLFLRTLRRLEPDVTIAERFSRSVCYRILEHNLGCPTRGVKYRDLSTVEYSDCCRRSVRRAGYYDAC